MRKTNDKVIEMFVNREGINATNHSESLRIVGDKLFNYNTVIAQYHDDKLYINETKYSVTTTKLVNKVKKEAYNYETVSGIPMGTHDIQSYSYL